jgi:hypothetical protein
MFTEAGFNPEIINLEPKRRHESFSYYQEHRDEFLYLLENATPVIKGDIDEIRPEIAGTHTNKVLMVEMPLPPGALENRKTSSAKLKFFEIHYGKDPLIGIYKPKSGENTYRKKEFSIKDMYPRETAAYNVDYYGQFGIVPPTIRKEIDGDEGSLQLYIPPEIGEVPDRIINLTDEELYSGFSLKKMAVFDRLIRQADRKRDNMIVHEQNRSEKAAIDNGCAYCTVKDSDNNIAYHYFRDHPEEAYIDEPLAQHLTNLLQNERQLLELDIPEDDRSLEALLNDSYDVLGTADKMLKTGSILIPY